MTIEKYAYGQQIIITLTEAEAQRLAERLDPIAEGAPEDPLGEIALGLSRVLP